MWRLSPTLLSQVDGIRYLFTRILKYGLPSPHLTHTHITIYGSHKIPFTHTCDVAHSMFTYCAWHINILRYAYMTITYNVEDVILTHYNLLTYMFISDVNECTNPHICHHGTCHNAYGSFTCHCNSGRVGGTMCDQGELR
jgi:hypothetical protein